MATVPNFRGLYSRRSGFVWRSAALTSGRIGAMSRSVATVTPRGGLRSVAHMDIAVTRIRWPYRITQPNFCALITAGRTGHRPPPLSVVLYGRVW